MLFGLSEFSSALRDGEERRKADRLDNARLYNDFLSANPGATVQERMDYANNLIKETGAGLGGLPSKAQMQRNYDKYKKEEAKKEAEEARLIKERERKIALENRRLAKEIGADLATMYGQDGFDAQLNAQFEEFDINPKLIPAATAEAKTAAWTKWKTDNNNLIQAYMDNPNKENLEAVMTAAGTLWQDDATNAYQGRHNTWIKTNTNQFAIELEDLARTATSVEDYNSKLASLKLKYPDEAYENVNFDNSDKPVVERRGEEYRSQLNDIINRNMSVEQTARAIQELNERYDNRVVRTNKGEAQTATELVATARNRLATEEIEALRGITDQAEYDRRKKAIQEKYDPSAIPDFGDMDAQIARNIKDKNDKALASLGNEAIRFANLASNQDEYNQLISTLVPPEGVEIGNTFLAANKIFEGRMEEQEAAKVQEDISAAQTAVESSDNIIRNAVEDNLTADDVIAKLEASISKKRGREVKLDEAQEKIIRDQFGGATEELTAEINQIAKSIMGENEKQFLLDSTKENFIANFVEALASKGIEDAESRFASMAETQFNIALDKVRAAADQAEIEKLTTATNAMEDGFGASRGININLQELSTYTEDVLGNSNVLGESDPTVVGSAIASDVNGFLQNIAIELNIPMSQDMAVMVVNELNRMASNSAQDGVTFLQDGKVTRAMIDQAFQQSFLQSPFKGSEFPSLEKTAMENALRAIKLTDIRELMNLASTDPKRALFQQEYSKARQEVRKATFDIHRGSVADDIAPAQTAVDNGTQSLSAVGDATQLISASTSMSDQNAYIATLGSGGSVVEAIEKTKEIGRNLETASSNLGSEIQRLSQLLKSPLYNQNLAEDRTTVQNELRALTLKKQEVDNAINGLQNTSRQLVDKIKRGKAEYEAEQAAEVERLSQSNDAVLQQSIVKKRNESPRNPQYTEEEEQYIKENLPTLLEIFSNPAGAGTSANRRRSNR